MDNCKGWLFLICAILYIPSGKGYPNFQKLIPNGQNVDNPFCEGQGWPGVGHHAVKGKGSLNPFGVDFRNTKDGLKWTRALCQLDSDGDGSSNGKELGDPDCKWTPDSTEALGPVLGHPGICEPVDSPLCEEKNKGFDVNELSCEPEKKVAFSERDTKIKKLISQLGTSNF